MFQRHTRSAWADLRDEGGPVQWVNSYVDLGLLGAVADLLSAVQHGRLADTSKRVDEGRVGLHGKAHPRPPR